MAQNHSVVNLDEYKKTRVRGGAKELEFKPSPLNFTPLPPMYERPPLKVVQESIPLKIKHPEVSQAGVVAHPESIEPEELEGTPATADPGTSHFKEAKPLPEQELEKRSQPLKLFWEYLFTGKKDTQKGEVWGDIEEVARFARKKHREKHPEEDGVVKKAA